MESVSGCGGFVFFFFFSFLDSFFFSRHGFFRHHCHLLSDLERVPNFREL